MEPMKHDALETQLDATRIKIYEQTKDMTTQERVAYFNNRGQEILKRHGLKATIAQPLVVQQQA
jgi:maleate cis-trans isomerase